LEEVLQLYTIPDMVIYLGSQARTRTGLIVYQDDTATISFKGKSRTKGLTRDEKDGRHWLNLGATNVEPKTSLSFEHWALRNAGCV